MLDSHCHVDLFDDPVGVSRRFESSLSGCVAVTMLPEHYPLALPHLKAFKHVFPALGAHPLRCSEAEAQLGTFLALAKEARFIGEVGLDGSREGKPTLTRQKRLFRRVLETVEPQSFVTVHSRSSWEETLETVEELGVRPVCFHYFTGGQAAALAVVRAGHFVSVNHKMVQPSSRHRDMVDALPRDRVLVESDAPFTGGGDPVSLVRTVYGFLGGIWGVEIREVEETVEQNFLSCRTREKISEEELFRSTPKVE